MNDFSKMSSFARLAEIFNKITEYSELIAEGGFSVPKKNRVALNPVIATWTIANIKNFNAGNPRLQEMINTCKDYLVMTEIDNKLTQSEAQT